METGARVLLAGFTAIVLMHFMRSQDEARAWLNFVFTGRTPAGGALNLPTAGGVRRPDWGSA